MKLEIFRPKFGPIHKLIHRNCA